MNRLLMGNLALLLALGVALRAESAEPQRPPAPVRIADVVGGHIHPSLCRTQTGEILAVYNENGGGGVELLLSRSRDGGGTWTVPAAIPTIKECSIYPGSLTTLHDGRVALHWSCYRVEADRRWREPQYCLSTDGGRTWSDPQSIPLADHTNYSCLRHPILELDDGRWVCPLYDRTIVYDPRTRVVSDFGDGRNHGMVPIIRTGKGSLVSGAPVADSPVPVGPPRGVVRGLRSTDGGQSWEPLHALPYFGVAGYDLITLDNGWILLTSIVYGVGRDREWAFEMIVSRDDGRTWDREHSLLIYDPGREIPGRGWPRTVQIDAETLGTVFFDLDRNQAGGPGLFFVSTPLAALAAE